MSKKILFILFYFPFIGLSQNLILNGSFENNYIVGCASTMNSLSWNDDVNDITSFGTDVALLRGNCVTCPSLPNYYWGGDPEEGFWFADFYTIPITLPNGTIVWTQSKIALHLSDPLSLEKNYKLSFYIKKPPPGPIDSVCPSIDNNSIEVGISNSPTSFGSLLYSTPLGDSVWTQYSIVFNTQNAEEYITVQVDTGDVNNYVVFADNFVLVETEEHVSINNINANKQLIKIVDILGRETPYKKNNPLFYIYSDGTVEKKIIVE